MNIYKSMGLEWLLEKNVWDSLDMHIFENTRYMIPGYKYNYRLCSFPGYIEFQRCESLDGTPIKTNMHFSANHHWNLEVRNIIKDDVSEPFYALKTKGGNDIPVRVICPDILPVIENGDIIEGQVVAFADSIVKLSDDITINCTVTDAGENCTNINGMIVDVNRGDFRFNETECHFWELDVETENGKITVLIAEDGIDFVPAEGNLITAHAMISMDIAVEHRRRKDAAFYEDQYEGLLEDTEVTYRNGFLLDFHRNQRVIVNAIKTGELSRFKRCFAKTVSFISDKDEDVCIYNVNKNQLIDAFKASLPEQIDSVEVKHILSCKVNKYLGHDAIAVYSNNELKLAIWFDICENGTIDEIEFIRPEDCELGIDTEFHLNAMYAHATCHKKWYILHEYITNGCMYRSEYADVCLVGAQNIIDRFADIDERINESNAYTFEFSLIEDELSEKDDLPRIYQGKHCTVNFQSNKLAYVAFLMINEEQKICNILMSCNGNYLKRFEPKRDSNNGDAPEIKSVIDILSPVYGTEDTIKTMRDNEIPDVDTDGVYVWKKADEFATSWLKDNGYKTSETVLVDDCIGYACERRGTSYAVFFYAYGERKTAMLDGDYCSKLRNEPIAQGREIIVIYLHVTKKTNDDGAIEYTVGSYGNGDSKIEPWLLTEVAGRSVLRFYPRKEMMALIPRLISAYNTKNLDALKVLCTENAFLDAYDSNGHSLNDGFYSHLSYIRENHGKMKLAYIRFTDVVFSAVPYIEDYAYVTFTAADKIDSIKMNPLNDNYRELLILDDDVDYCPANVVPALSSVEFLKPSDISRFSLRLVFDNGETKRYNLAGEFNDDEIVNYQGKIMTDKIFSNGRVVEHIPMIDWMGYRNYAERGQGIEFMSGATLSVEELYHNSYPIEKFSYAGIDDVHVMQMDYDEDGFGVGYIHNLDPKNPNYLLDSNTMTAVVIPDEYQETPIGVYPFYGGYSEGLIMVSKFGELDLQYHHNRGPCAGLWGWLDRDFNIAIEPKYVYAMNFVNGRAIVCKGDWDVKTTKDGKEQYWCDNEQWGVIDQNENEIVPCRFDELYEIDNTDRLYFVHEGGWENGHYAVFDTKTKEVILVLDFDFDIGYMFNECFVADGDILVFDEHLPGEEKDLIYAYDLINKQYIAHGEPLEGRTYNGETKSVVNKDGKDIIIF